MEDIPGKTGTPSGQHLGDVRGSGVAVIGRESRTTGVMGIEAGPSEVPVAHPSTIDKLRDLVNVGRCPCRLIAVLGAESGEQLVGI